MIVWLNLKVIYMSERKLSIDISDSFLLLIRERREYMQKALNRDFSFDQDRYRSVMADIACEISLQVEAAFDDGLLL